MSKCFKGLTPALAKREDDQPTFKQRLVVKIAPNVIKSYAAYSIWRKPVALNSSRHYTSLLVQGILPKLQPTQGLRFQTCR